MVVTGRSKNLYCYLLSGLIIGFIATLFWPGYMSPDSITQLNQGLNGSYSDHHPPMMSVLWRLFSHIHSGPQVYLMFHLLLLFCSVCLLQSIAKQIWLKFSLAFLPLMPSLVTYSGALWKDVGFAYSFLLAAMMLTRSNVTQQKMTWSQGTVVIFLLIYGVGVKYQAQFVLPVMCLWLGLTLNDQKFSFRSVCVSMSVTLSILIAVASFNKFFVPMEKESHSWQMVKLYDLAGMSVRDRENLFPNFITSQPFFSLAQVTERYSSERVDDLIEGWSEAAPLKLARTLAERDILWDTWVNAVLHHPTAYLTHRFALWCNMLSKSPLKPMSQLKSFNTVPEKTKLIMKIVEKTVFSVIYEMSRFYVMLPFLLTYLVWGSRLCRQNSSYGLPLITISLAGCSLLGCLLIFSMASDLRYVYMVTCFIFFSHPLAIMAWLDKREQRLSMTGLPGQA